MLKLPLQDSHKPGGVLLFPSPERLPDLPTARKTKQLKFKLKTQKLNRKNLKIYFWVIWVFSLKPHGLECLVCDLHTPEPGSPARPRETSQVHGDAAQGLPRKPPSIARSSLSPNGDSPARGVTASTWKAERQKFREKPHAAGEPGYKRRTFLRRGGGKRLLHRDPAVVGETSRGNSRESHGNCRADMAIGSRGLCPAPLHPAHPTLDLLPIQMPVTGVLSSLGLGLCSACRWCRQFAAFLPKDISKDGHQRAGAASQPPPAAPHPPGTFLQRSALRSQGRRPPRRLPCGHDAVPRGAKLFGKARMLLLLKREEQAAKDFGFVLFSFSPDLTC